jgi:hypothetical protein
MFDMWERVGFSWEKAIAVNRQALLAVVAAILAMLNIDEDEPLRLPRAFHRRVLRLLTPAESAARRLIVLAARDLVVKPLSSARVARPAPQGLRTRALGRAPSFRLHDPRLCLPELVQKRRKRKMPDHLLPRIWLLGDDPPYRPPPPPVPPDDGMVTALPVRRRLDALQAALDDLPGQARRLARWRANRERQRARRPTFIQPLRPGLPPGWRKKPVCDIDRVLHECHGLAMALDTS